MAQVTIRSEVSCLGSVLLGFLAYIMPDKIRKIPNSEKNTTVNVADKMLLPSVLKIVKNSKTAKKHINKTEKNLSLFS